MEYKVPHILSSREFYKMLDVFDAIINQDEVFVLDFTNVTKIDAVVIPNLLLLGRYLEQKTFNIPYIRLGENLSAGYLKKYLSNIKFYQLSELYFYYENEAEKYGGLLGKDMDDRNTTERFSIEDGAVVARRRLYYNIFPFIKHYLKNFNIYENDVDLALDQNTFNNNIIAKFLEQMIDNSFAHGMSDAFVTVQTNYKMNRIYMSISDFGVGFYKSILAEMPTKSSDEVTKNNDNNILMRNPKNELEAIWIGIYKRRNSETYGLYNVIKSVLKLNGTIRIHSNDTQLILTDRLIDKFLKGTLINSDQLTRYNIIRTSHFEGVHIEIEIPLNYKSVGEEDHV